MDRVRSTIKKLDKTDRDLARLVKNDTNSKREIKDITTTIRSLSSSVCTEDAQKESGNGSTPKKGSKRKLRGT